MHPLFQQMPFHGEMADVRLAETKPLGPQPPAPPAVRVATIRLPFDQPLVKSFFFAENDSASFFSGQTGSQKPKSANATWQSSPTAKSQHAIKSQTRLKPPRDIVKLVDRLYLMLQPPLESLVTSGTIEFPFAPFAHQYEGVAFLFPRQVAILADEMGLGKTMQAITTIRLLLRSGQISRSLLICPKPLVTNWVREFNSWAPEIPICVIQGNQAKRNWQWRDAEIPVKIANYELIHRDTQSILDQELGYDLVVLDEAQRIKNRLGTTNKAICSIPRQRSWALTGTPVENSSDDLVGIFEFLSSGYLNSRMTTRSMRQAVRDYILRRTKSEVMTDMPPLLNRDAILELNSEQRHAYEQAESQGVFQLNELGRQISIQHVFELVLRLKQICNFDPASGSSAKIDRLKADLSEVIASGKKSIVFSQWVKTIKQISSSISQANPLEYHGQIPSRKRDAVLAEFQDNPDRHVLLMSYGAGAVGLNLQFCRYVFLFDQWWNPAVEDQAINRAHRIGAAGSVTVTRLISENTIEERINQVLQDKRELFQQILCDTDQPGRLGLSKAEIFGLFDLRAGGKPLNNVA